MARLPSPAAGQVTVPRLAGARDLFRLAALPLAAALAGIDHPARRRQAITRVARLAGRCDAGNRALGRAALARALGDRLAPDAREAVLDRSFETLWLDLVWLHRAARRDSAAPAVATTGIDHLKQALERGRGAILVESAGFGLRFLAKRILRDLGFTVCQVHGPQHFGGRSSRVAASLVTPRIERLERQVVRDVIWVDAERALTASRVLLERLGDNQIVCLSGDGSEGRRAIDLPFLGHTRAFATGVGSLNRQSGAPLLPLFCHEDATEIDFYRLTIEPPISPPTELPIQHPTVADPGHVRERALAATVAEVARRLEAQILSVPGSYVLWHTLVPGVGHHTTGR